MNFNLIRNKHLEKNSKNQFSNVNNLNNYNKNKANFPNKNLNQSLNKGKSSTHNQTPKTNKSLIGKNEAEAINKNKPLSASRIKSTTIYNKNLKEKHSIKTDYNSYINGKNLSERKASNTNYSGKKTFSRDNAGNNLQGQLKIKRASTANLNLIPDDVDLFVSDNFSESNKNSGAEKFEFLKEKENKNIISSKNNNNHFGCNIDRSRLLDNSKDESNNHYSKDLDKIFNSENEEKDSFGIKQRSKLNHKKEFEEKSQNNKQPVKILINKNNYENLVYKTENNYDHDKSQINLNTSQNKNNKNTYKNLNTSINALNNINTSRNLGSKYNFTSFNQTLSKNSNYTNNNSNKVNNRYEENGPTILKQAASKFSNLKITIFL